MVSLILVLQFDADVVVLATGFKRPDMSFLPKDLFPEGYDVSIKTDCTGRPVLMLGVAAEPVPAEFLHGGLVGVVDELGIHERDRHCVSPCHGIAWE